MKKLVFLMLFALACKQNETVSTSTSTTETSATTVTSATAATTTTTPVTTDTGTTVAVPTATTATTAKSPAGKPATATTTTTAAKTSTTSTVAPPPATTTTAAPAPAPAPVTTTTSAPAASSNAAADGATLFKTRGCTACHGANAAGDTAMAKKNNIPDFHSAAVQNKSDAELATIITEGGKNPLSQSGHKSKHLTGDEAKSVVAWIRTLK